MSEQQREPSNAKAEAAKKTAESADVANEAAVPSLVAGGSPRLAVRRTRAHRKAALPSIPYPSRSLPIGWMDSA